jgi:CheY-like chemotaxis protein
MSTPSLLVVDDSRLSRMMISKIVADLRPGWKILEAASGDEALAVVEREQPSFVSMDINMPGMNGLEAAGRIRLHHPDIRIVMNSANIQEAVRQAAEKVGVFFVAKPITPESVAKMVAHFEG